MHPRLFQFGHVAVPTYGALTALALVVALAAAMQFAKRLSLDVNKVWALSITGILTTLIGARLLVVIAHFDVFRQHPFWVLGLATLRDWWVTPLSVALGIAAGALYALAEGVSILSVADALAPAVALAFAINRIGAFIGGIGFGTPAAVPWAVTYTSRISALWYRTPLGVPLHPLQIYETIVSLVAFGLLLWRMPLRGREGELAGAGLFIFGLANPVLNLWSAGLDHPVFSLVLSIAAVLAGGALLFDRRQKPRRYTASDETLPL